jgi:hypothetical protein
MGALRHTVSESYRTQARRISLGSCRKLSDDVGMKVRLPVIPSEARNLLLLNHRKQIPRRCAPRNDRAGHFQGSPSHRLGRIEQRCESQEPLIENKHLSRDSQASKARCRSRLEDFAVIGTRDLIFVCSQSETADASLCIGMTVAFLGGSRSCRHAAPRNHENDPSPALVPRAPSPQGPQGRGWRSREA